MVIHHSTYTSSRTSRKRDRWSLMEPNESTGSYIAAKWHRAPSADPTPRFTCGRHIVAALLVLIFGVATTAALQDDGRSAESASAASHQDVPRPQSL